MKTTMRNLVLSLAFGCAFAAVSAASACEFNKTSAQNDNATAQQTAAAQQAVPPATN